MSTDRPPRRAFLASLAALMAFSAVGCGGYGTVSPRTYDIAKALYGACSRRKVESLDAVEKIVDESLVAGEITDREAGWLRDIAATARSGAWEEAQKEARKLMEDQVR